MTPLRTRILIALSGSLLGWGSVMLASSSACTHQPGSPEPSSATGWELTVEEADGSIAASCVLLAQLMTKNQPKIVDQVVAQACQPGKTREQIAAIVAKLSEESSTQIEVWEKGESLAPLPRELSDAGAR